MFEWAAVGFFHSLLKPVGNGVFVNRLNFRIRNRHGQIQSLAGFVLPLTDFFQITRKEQEVPKVILRLMNIAVGDILMHRFFNRAVIDQGFQICFCHFVRFSYHFAHNAVGRSI